MNTRSEEYFQALGTGMGVDIRPNDDGTYLVVVDGTCTTTPLTVNH